MRLIFILLTAISFSASGEVYKWTDADGNVHFGSQPPPGQNQTVDIRESAPGDMGASASAGRVLTNEEAKSSPESPTKALAETTRRANERACALAKSELESAERMLTLAQSQNAYDFVLERREKKVKHWRSRVDTHCTSR